MAQVAAAAACQHPTRPGRPGAGLSEHGPGAAPRVGPPAHREVLPPQELNATVVLYTTQSLLARLSHDRGQRTHNHLYLPAVAKVVDLASSVLSTVHGGVTMDLSLTHRIGLIMLLLVTAGLAVGCQRRARRSESPVTMDDADPRANRARGLRADRRPSAIRPASTRPASTRPAPMRPERTPDFAYHDGQLHAGLRRSSHHALRHPALHLMPRRAGRLVDHGRAAQCPPTGLWRPLGQRPPHQPPLWADAMVHGGAAGAMAPCVINTHRPLWQPCGSSG